LSDISSVEPTSVEGSSGLGCSSGGLQSVASGAADALGSSAGDESVETGIEIGDNDITSPSKTIIVCPMQCIAALDRIYKKLSYR